jgi:predicted permease
MTLPDGVRRLFRLPSNARSAGRDAARDVDDELRFHLESRVDALVAAGLSPAAAEAEARREFGDVRAARTELAAIDRGRLRRAGRTEWWAGWRQDARFAWRALRRRPGFAAAVLLTLALGLGATGAIFAAADAALLRPLPYAEPDALVHLWRTHARALDAKGDLSYPDFLDLRERAGAFAGLAGYHSNRVVLGAGDRPQVLWAGKTTANFFAVLGARPAAGRFFAEGEDATGAPRVAVLSHALWTRQFAGDPGVVGRSVRLDGAPYTVVGVLPPHFQFAPVGAADVWVPFDRPADWRERRSMSWFRVVARLKAGVTPASAGRELDALAATLSREHPRENAESGMRLVPLGDEVTGSVRPLLVTLLGASALVLVVALANVANLLLVRGTARARELGVRAALGAGRGRLVRQLLTESVLIALLGGALGLVLARLGVRALIAAIPPERLRGMPYLAELGLGWRMLACTLLVSLVAGVLFGLIPAARVLRPRLADALRQGARGSSEGGSGGRLRDALVAAELGLTVVLLTGAVLFGRSLSRVFAVDPGFRAERVATALVPLPRAAYTSRAARAQFFVQLEERARALPGVESVGLTTKLPLDPGNSTSYRVVGAPEPAPGHAPEASFRSVNGDYFRTLGIPLVRGTTFSGRRDSLAAREVVVSAALAREAFGAADPIGRQLETGGRRACDDRRHRRRRRDRPDRGRRAADVLRALHAGTRRVDADRGAHARRRWPGGRGRAPRGAGDRPRGRALPGVHDGEPDAPVGVGVPAPLPAAAARRVRGDRAAAGGRGHVRRGELRGRAARARAGHPHRARRVGAQRDDARRRPRGRDRGGGHRGRAGAGGRALALRRGAAVRRARDRSGHLRQRGRAARRRGGRRGGDPRAPRQPRRSGDGAARGLSAPAAPRRRGDLRRRGGGHAAFSTIFSQFSSLSLKIL